MSFTKFIVTAALWLLTATASAQTIGLHLVSAHFPDGGSLNNQNTGAYIRFDNGLTAGAYKNTINRNSVYLGYTVDHGPFSLTVGGITGYKYQKRFIPCQDPKREKNCYEWEGNSKYHIMPMAVPSVRLPTILGATPRLSFMPSIGFGAKHSVVHLSIEAKM